MPTEGADFGECHLETVQFLQYVSSVYTSPQTHCSSHPGCCPLAPGQQCQSWSPTLPALVHSPQAARGIFSKPRDHLFPLLKILQWLPTAHRKITHSTWVSEVPVMGPLTPPPYCSHSLLPLLSLPATHFFFPTMELHTPFPPPKTLCPLFIVVQMAPSHPSGLV